jgi:hypothetical protein
MHGALEVVSECDDSDDSDDRSDGDSDSDSDGDSGDDSDGDSDGNSGGGASGSGGSAAARERARSDASTVLARAKQEFSLFKEVLDSQSTAETPRIGEGLRREGIRKRIDSGGTSGSREAVVPSEAGIDVLRTGSVVCERWACKRGRQLRSQTRIKTQFPSRYLDASIPFGRKPN